LLDSPPDLEMDSTDCVVIGAGAIGLAVARSLAKRGYETLVVESEGTIGSGISSRNSEVIHAGIYPQGSLKVTLCVEGRHELYAYCDARGVPYRSARHGVPRPTASLAIASRVTRLADEWLQS
jgi:L-2-hydroxyglutarate oxidase LhgO